jgi:hypothetical protein
MNSTDDSEAGGSFLISSNSNSNSNSASASNATNEAQLGSKITSLSTEGKDIGNTNKNTNSTLQQNNNLVPGPVPGPGPVPAAKDSSNAIASNLSLENSNSNKPCPVDNVGWFNTMTFWWLTEYVLYFIFQHPHFV